MSSIKTVLLASLLLVLAFGCSEDDSNDGEIQQSESTQIVAPRLEKILTTTTTDDVSFRARFNSGGDSYENMKCTVHWRKYSERQSETPRPSDMTNHETMRQYGSTSRSVTFDKSHAGFYGGEYLYYYFECSNSKRTVETDVTFCVIKR